MNYFEQLERMAQQQGGFFYPWRSELGAGNGEAAYTRRVTSLLRAGPRQAVIEAGCGHGADALAFAPLAGQLVAYDAVQGLLGVAERQRAGRGQANVLFVRADSSPKRGGCIPVRDGWADLVISRRGPTSFIADAARVTRPGGRLVQLNPLGGAAPDWNSRLPDALRLADDPDTVHDGVRERLAGAGLAPESERLFDVEERFRTSLDLYRYLAWMRPDAPGFATVRPLLDDLFVAGQPVVARQRRLLWEAVVS